MRFRTSPTDGAHFSANLLTLGMAIALTALSASSAVAHIIPWRDGMSRTIGFGRCAKGPCMTRYDFGPSVRHAHLEIAGRHTVVLCSGLGRQNSNCPSPWQGSRR